MLTQKIAEEMAIMWQQGIPYRQIAKKLNVETGDVQRMINWLRDQGVTLRRRHKYGVLIDPEKVQKTIDKLKAADGFWEPDKQKNSP